MFGFHANLPVPVLGTPASGMPRFSEQRKETQRIGFPQSPIWIFVIPLRNSASSAPLRCSFPSMFGVQRRCSSQKKNKAAVSRCLACRPSHEFIADDDPNRGDRNNDDRPDHDGSNDHDHNTGDTNTADKADNTGGHGIQTRAPAASERRSAAVPRRHPAARHTPELAERLPPGVSEREFQC
jgi:hypothetical protein